MMEKAYTDLLIIGSGIAGLSAALQAARDGVKKITILEARKVTGGNSRFAAGIFACHETDNPEEPSMDELYRRILSYHRLQFTDPMIIKTYLSMSEGTIEWLKELGIEFLVNGAGPNAGRQRTATTFNIPKGKKRNGIYNVILAMRQKLEELGVEICTQTRATELIKEDGRVTGAIVSVKEKCREIRAEAVILATGGFTGNTKWLKKYFSYYREDYEGHMIPFQGDGLEMALAAGAGTYDRPGMVRETMRDWAPSYLHFPLILALKQKGFVAVNQKGRRVISENFISDESNMTCNILDQQPDGVIYIIYDDRLISEIDSIPKRGVAGNLPGLREVFEILNKSRKGAVIADSLKEAADWIGAEEQVLKKTLEDYNICVREGEDRDFGRSADTMREISSPPYYILKIGALMIDTIGPIRINYKAEVLDTGLNVIPGLYCAGVAAGGWSSDDYCARYQFGSCIGFSCNYGRQAGRNAAGYISARLSAGKRQEV